MGIKKIEVTFQPEGKRVRVTQGSTIFEAAKLAGIDIAFVCGGTGKCGKCKIIVNDRKGVGAISAIERRLLPDDLIEDGYRLACFTELQSDVVVTVPEASRTGKQRLQVEGIETPIILDPMVRKYHVKLSQPTLEDTTADLERLCKGLEEAYGLRGLEARYGILPRLPVVLRSCAWDVTAAIWGGKNIIAVEIGDTTNRNFGIAVDIGTTKLASYLLDLNSGHVLAVESMMNPQVSFGEDVITRITYASKCPKAQKELQEVLIGGLNQLITRLLDKMDISLNELYEMVVVGNTAMHHLFLKLCPTYVGLAPYPAVLRRGIDITPDALGLHINPNGNVHVLPVIAGFVGADSVADILATELYRSKELSLAIDVGTNTEVILGNNEWMLGCSCASGPAFEGAHIMNGMRAATGAIEKVKINPETLELEYRTIDGAKASGICGSAIVDLPAEMLMAGIIDLSGIFIPNEDNPRLRQREGLYEYVVAWKGETSIERDIVITQKDLQEIQFAKAAIYTGIEILMKNAHLEDRDIERVFIAGAFGYYIDPKSARTIGMYPEIPLSKVRQVGNSAGTGARMSLVSRKARADADLISHKVRYVELAKDPDFSNIYMNAYFLPNADLTKFPETSQALRTMGRYPDVPPPILR
uniref:DUF4445 domain-containing protein n=1 Tax=Candidatus Methanomethylicus mesodigestus TaxID=1867258 RepID=A0A7C3F9H5_9CREN